MPAELAGSLDCSSAPLALPSEDTGSVAARSVESFPEHELFLKFRFGAAKDAKTHVLDTVTHTLESRPEAVLLLAQWAHAFLPKFVVGLDEGDDACTDEVALVMNCHGLYGRQLFSQHVPRSDGLSQGDASSRWG